ncbi:mannose-1-phosphate guanylyltransferase [Actinopolymorpha singaporensis]|uniref:Mannose-1-phosphate guanylyltransferase n=1 Tax=Actinopolymorpha singaporensis TaxID=117157 RepID=A0A1H1SU80_9ACTN|nr:sugar phosphate nucleotidyltransferase [Actinopolymorpha singaporensis]SDS51501.1 mannose-1-phosphate guanylyltransferase [Actinopolymorpha singaporensis]
MRYAVINAGGAGTRLWPLSRASFPKQLLSVRGGKSLLRLAYERLEGFVPDERIFVCAGTTHQQVIMEHLPELPEENFLGEPVARDTANAIGLACAVIVERDPDAVAAFVTADHVIEPVESFREALGTAFATVEAHPQMLATFGVPPTSAHTGLGYIERAEPLPDAPGSAGPGGGPAVFGVTAFTEKPDAATAQAYVAGGRHLWNSGMFVWRADTLLTQLHRHLPGAYDGVTRIAKAWDTPERTTVAEKAYAELPKISIDYAVMEPAARGEDEARVVVVPMSVDWIDVGAWPALARTLANDPAHNASNAVTVLVDSEGNIVVSDDPEHLVATVGLRDTIVVHTPDVTMVCPKNDAERVKDLVARVRQTHGDRYA